METVGPRGICQELAAEAFGVFLIIAFGAGVVATGDVKGASVDEGAWAQGAYMNQIWGMGVALAVLATFDITGAQLNPAVTLFAAVFGGFPICKVLPYIIAQTIGGFLGAIVVMANFVLPYLGTDDESKYLTNYYCTSSSLPTLNALATEVTATALLLIVICSCTTGSTPAYKPMVAAWVGTGVYSIGNSFGVLTGYAMNPARDLGPRIAYWGLLTFTGDEDALATVMSRIRPRHRVTLRHTPSPPTLDTPSFDPSPPLPPGGLHGHVLLLDSDRWPPHWWARRWRPLQNLSAAGDQGGQVSCLVRRCACQNDADKGRSGGGPGEKETNARLVAA